MDDQKAASSIEKKDGETIPTFKIVFIGDACSNKSKITDLYRIKKNHESTTGARYKTEDILSNSGKCSFRIWDPSGDDRFASLVPIYCHHHHAIIITANANIEGQLESLQKWFDFINNNGIISKDSLIIIAATYSINENPVEMDKLYNFAFDHKFDFFKISVEFLEHMDEMFDYIERNLLRKYNAESNHLETTACEEQVQRNICSIY